MTTAHIQARKDLAAQIKEATRAGVRLSPAQLAALLASVDAKFA